MAKFPAFQFYPGDWRKDTGVQSLSYHDRGIWWEMLCLMHESERRGVLTLNGKAMTEDCLARLLGLDKQILGMAITSLLEFGVASRESDTGAIFCRRMVRDEHIRKIRSEAGSKGGNPALVNQNSSKTENNAKQKSTPSARKMKVKNETEVEVLYGLYPRKVGKAKAAEEIAKALKLRPFDTLLLAVKKYRAWCDREQPEEQFIPHPATWFHQGRYDDPEPAPRHKNGGLFNGKGSSNDAALAEAIRDWESAEQLGDVPAGQGR